MKSFLAKFRVSNSLDERKPIPTAVERAISNDDELRQFTEESAALEKALKSSPPETQAPAALHGSIMRAVRAGNFSRPALRSAAWWRWLPAPALALLALLAILWTSHHSPESGTLSMGAKTQTLAAATSALELAGNTIHEAPSAAMAPLNDEMKRLGRDMDNAGQFLLTSLP
jgi:hypothetical protein